MSAPDCLTWNLRAPLGFYPGYVYLAKHHNSGLYKIGRTAKPPKMRMTELSREHRGEVMLLHAIATNNCLRLEREVMRRFLSAHVTKEWFALAAEQIEAIRSVSAVSYVGVKEPKWFRL